ncbi:sarcinarray family MAST domain-containing protein [Methanolobus psychrotolerans]|uniref:sarcinarray family MAST domain-containing protein n=1 Tax=Methanolobus psychrotolerans TaxID=1874706 RepID=UPI000B9178FD|nr:sarcinarray family MAST domain-containing protein [Methanolobus psychrotolerans]
MNYKMFAISLICLFVLFSIPASSESSNLKIDVYYNDQLYPGASTPKPLLKIGEPFQLRFEVTCYKKNELSAKLTSIGDNDFDIIEGPTSKLGAYTDKIMEANETWIIEWTVAPNEEWAGGSAPINFYYQMMDLERPKTIANGKFTAAYVTISNEYYDGPAIPSESTNDPTSESSSPTTPAFTALFAVFALIAAVVYRKE